MVKAYPTTTHTLELSEQEANQLAGFLWEALDKLVRVNDSAVPMTGVASATMKTLFESCGHDVDRYSGTGMLKFKS